MIGISSGFLVGEYTNFETGEHVDHYSGMMSRGGYEHVLVDLARRGGQGFFLCLATVEAPIFYGGSQLSPF